jgi:hypothetical protein
VYGYFSSDPDATTARDALALRRLIDRSSRRTASAAADGNASAPLGSLLHSAAKVHA